MLGLILLGGMECQKKEVSVWLAPARSGPSEPKPVIAIGGMCQVHAGALGSERVAS